MRKGFDLWVRLIAMIAMIVSALVLIDFAIGRVMPIRHLREAADGIRDLRAGDPVTLVVGSSHGRTFHALGEEVSRRLGDKGELVSIPLENGKLTSYQWLMEHRVWSLVDERDANDEKVRPHLRKFILLTEWWDSCDYDPKVYWNLPGRAWDFTAYVDDVLRNGFTPFNRNYVQYQTIRAFDKLTLFRDRLSRRLPRLVSELTGLTTPDRRNYAKKVTAWRGLVEGGMSCIGALDQMRALDAILASAQARGLETRVVLFPRKPDTISVLAEATTIRRFRELVDKVATRHDMLVLDLTLATPLLSSDFMDDFDHVSPEGNQKFADWALGGPFADLLEPAPAQGAGTAVAR
jgi:hypothetical protein